MADQGGTPAERQRDPRLVRDVISVLLLVLGAGLVLSAAWSIRPVVGVLVTGVFVIVVGFALGLDR